MQIIKKYIAVFLFFLVAINVFSSENENNENNKNPLIAASETLASNIILLGYNHFIADEDYANITWHSMYENLNHKWVWDQDEFSVNQIGHPYQGSYYFISSRANSLNFWESMAMTSYGSITWELFFETEWPSKNDYIVTTLGGATTGEMLHRLHLEAKDSKFHWLSYFLSPMDVINTHITGQPSPAVPDSISEADTMLFAGTLRSKTSFDDSDQASDKNNHPLCWGIGLNIIYGKPFGHITKTPYDHFELKLQCDFASWDYFCFTMFSDGLLWSCAPFDDLNSRTTLGTSLHYDFIYSSDVTYSGHALGVTLKQRMFLKNNFDLDIKLHLNWLVLGSTEYYYFQNGIKKPESDKERRNYDLGTGENVKLSLSLSQPLCGNFSLWGMFSGIHTINEAVPEGGSDGYTAITILGFSYDHLLKNNCYIGFADTMYIKNGFYDHGPVITDNTNFFSLYMKIKNK